MGLPVLLVENFFSRTQFPNHTISASSEASGNEAWRVGTGRRSSRNKWVPTSAGTQEYLQASLDRTRSADMLVLDRGHNLGGKTVRLRATDDPNWASYREVFAISVPTDVVPAQPLQTSPGALTEEGAWLFAWSPPEAARYWRFVVDAVSGFKAQVVGLYLGLAFRPSYLFELPWSWGQRELVVDEVVSEEAWVGTTRPAQRTVGALNLRLRGAQEYDLARYHIEAQYLRRKPMWVVFDSDQAERSVLVVPPRGTVGFSIEEGWGYMQAQIPYVEHEPKF